MPHTRMRVSMPRQPRQPRQRHACNTRRYSHRIQHAAAAPEAPGCGRTDARTDNAATPRRTEPWYASTKLPCPHRAHQGAQCRACALYSTAGMARRTDAREQPRRKRRGMARRSSNSETSDGWTTHMQICVYVYVAYVYVYVYSQMYACVRA